MRSAGSGLTATTRSPLDSPDFWRAVADSVPDMLLLVDREGTLLYVNHAREGTCVEDVVGQSALDYVPADSRDELRGSLREIFEGAPARLREQRGVHADGTERWYATHCGGVRLNAEVVAAIVVARDVTEQRQVAERTRNWQKLEALGQLSAGLVHDFNNVLAIVGMAAQLIAERTHDDPTERADVETILTEARRGAALTRQLLAFARHQPPSVGEVDLNDVVRDVAAMVRNVVHGRITLLEQLHPAGAVVRGDRTQLDQVVMNLVLNARDATEPGGTISLMTAVVPCGVRLLVSDTGSGMTDETREHIFEPFFTTKDKAGGTGLGLSTVHAIVSRAGGTIEVCSVPTLGTTFVVTLPPATAPGE